MEASSDAAPLRRLMGTDARAELVSAFLRRPGKELTASEVSDIAGVDRSSVYRHVDILVDVGLVEEVEGGSGRSFRLNMDDELAQSLGETHQLLVRRSQAVAPPEIEEEPLAEDPLGDLLPEPLTADLVKRLLSESSEFREGLIELAERCIHDLGDDDTGLKIPAAAGASRSIQGLKSRLRP